MVNFARFSPANAGEIRRDHERGFREARIPWKYYERTLEAEFPAVAETWGEVPALFVGPAAMTVANLFARRVLTGTQRMPVRIEAAEAATAPETMFGHIRRMHPVLIEGLEATLASQTQFWAVLGRLVMDASESGRPLLLTSLEDVKHLPTHAFDNLRKVRS